MNRQERRAREREIRRTCDKGQHLPKVGDDTNKPFCARCGDPLPARDMR